MGDLSDGLARCLHSQVLRHFSLVQEQVLLLEVNLRWEIVRILGLVLSLSCAHFIKELLNFGFHVTIVISLNVHLDDCHLHEWQNVFQLSTLCVINLLVDVREIRNHKLSFFIGILPEFRDVPCIQLAQQFSNRFFSFLVLNIDIRSILLLHIVVH